MPASRPLRQKQATIDDLRIFVDTATLMLRQHSAPFTTHGALRTKLKAEGVAAPSTWIHTIETLAAVYGGELISPGKPRLTPLGMRVFLNARRVLATYVEGRVAPDRTPEHVTLAVSQSVLHLLLAHPLGLWLGERKKLAQSAGSALVERRREEDRLVRLFETRLDESTEPGLTLQKALDGVEQFAARPPIPVSSVIRVREQVFTDTVHDLRVGNVDIGIAAKPLHGSWDGVAYCRLIGGITTKVACHPGCSLPKKPRFADLHDKPLCLVASDLDGLLAGRKLPLPEGMDRLVVEHYSSAAALIRTGAAYGLLPALDRVESRDLKLHDMHHSECLPEREIGIWVNPSVPLKDTARHLLEFLISEASELPVRRGDREELTEWLNTL
jgi:DNA-binding transcriptional LysR family regulator